ncbi:sugar transferase [Allopusillimonas ginsengisoli]|uniref:sugar transferase n=1 Tax=Allopusillimonas ginsengisoli TaxID=453575 RepID=UPI001021B275|nr:sugar transferase [Allopusillimonas ginsengisoli]TEA79956.1 sugar transferase [Allopusillimonas ginsengisoli]
MAKRLFDVIVAAGALLLLAPVFLVLAYKVRRNLGSPVLFRQMRPGLKGQMFEMIKFRSMREPQELMVSDAERLTPFGIFLRSTSLDELPELWNVLKGEMSLVGPRPLLSEYLPLYSPTQHRRHEVRPGITGWAQVNGRNSLSWDEKFQMDVWYVDHHTFWLDLKILARTIKKVIGRRDINPANQVSMPKFTGSKPQAENTQTP